MTKLDRRTLLKAASATAVLSACGEPEMPNRILMPGRRYGDDEGGKNPIYTRQPPASPVHLSGSLLLRPGASGSVPPASLKNPMGQDMELLEVRFELAAQAQGSLSTAVTGGSIWCDLAMGSIKLTNGAIPVWNFGREENLDLSSVGPINLANSIPNYQSFSYFTWRLPRPLFIPAGGAVVPNFTHTGFLDENINVRIGYSARTVFKKPKKLYVPWVAKYATKAFNPISAADTDMSSQLDLVNPHPEVVFLQRFVGRTQALYTSASSSEVDPSFFGSKTLQLRMTDSYGRPIVGNYTPFRSVFEANTRSWEMDNGASLDPESYYLVQIRKTAEALTGGTLYAGAVGQAFISLVGWREMEAV